MKLIYIMDPYCGWCYGNSSAIDSISQYFDFDWEILLGGMWSGHNIKKQDQNLAQLFISHDPRIADLTGVEFTQKYFDFVQSYEVDLDSEVPSRAIVAFDHVAHKKIISFVKEVQKARYFYGLDLNNYQVYIDIVKWLKVDHEHFIELFNSDDIKNKTKQSFDKSRYFSSSYPTLIAQKGDSYTLLQEGFSQYLDIKKKIENILTL